MHFLDKRTRGKVLGLRVRCSKDGCDWEGEFGDLERHLSKCLYVKIVCPYGCGQLHLRHTLHSHQQHECPKRSFYSHQLETGQEPLKYGQDNKQQLVQEEQQKQDKMLQQQLVQQKLMRISKFTMQIATLLEDYFEALAYVRQIVLRILLT